MEKGQWAMPVVQAWHGHFILELDSPSSSTEGPLLMKVMLIPRPCLYPQAAAARGQGGLCLHSLALRCSRPWSGVGREQGRFLGKTELIQWWCWRCGLAGSIAAFLLGCWVPPLWGHGCFSRLLAAPGYGCCPWMAHVLSLAMWD